MFVVKYRKIFYIISAVLMAVSILAVLVYGLKFGIDFTGGALNEIHYSGAAPDRAAVEGKLNNLPIGTYSLRPTGEGGYILRTRDLSETERVAVFEALTTGGAQVATQQYNSIGPTIGSELRTKAALAIALVILAIVFFIAFAFRKVSEPVSSWKYGLVAIAALLHDVIIPAGVFAVLGHFAGVEVDTLFVTAVLVVLGFSVHDTIVVFDRVRENLRVNHERGVREDFADTVGKSIGQTFNRSINTSLSVLISLLALYFFGGDATKNFALALLIGIVAGTYSSIFLGSPLLVTLQRWQKK